MTDSNDTHLKSVGYILWIFGFTGAHRFYFGKPISGTIYFFTLGLLGIGWIIDLFLIPSMDRQASIALIRGHIKDEHLIRHCLATGAVMKNAARIRPGSESLVD